MAGNRGGRRGRGLRAALLVGLAWALPAALALAQTEGAGARPCGQPLAADCPVPAERLATASPLAALRVASRPGEGAGWLRRLSGGLTAVRSEALGVDVRLRVNRDRHLLARVGYERGGVDPRAGGHLALHLDLDLSAGAAAVALDLRYRLRF